MKFEIDQVRWKANFPHNGVDATKAHRSLEGIKAELGGTLNVDAVISKARSKRHVLHDIFEWSDDVAAMEYRREQGRRLMRSLEVTYKERPKEPQRVYEVVHKNTPGRREGVTLYGTHEEMLDDPAAREQHIADAIRQLMYWRRRFKHLNEMDRVFSAIDAVIDDLGEGD